MKKNFLFVVFIFLSFSIFSFDAFCADGQANVSTENAVQDVYDIVDSDTREILSSFGLDELNGENIYSFSVSGISNFFSKTLSQRLRETFKTFLLLCSVMLVLGAVSTLFQSENDETAQLLCCVVMCLFALSKLSETMNAVLAVLNLSSKFVMSYIPIFAALIAMGGNPATALAYNTVVMAFAQGLSAFCVKLAVPIVGGFFCLCICFSFNERINLDRFNSAFSKFSGVALGFFSSVFASMLSIKGILGSSADTVASRGIRFTVSSMIPVVGSAISEAYGAIVGSIGLVKGSVAVVGIIVCLVINIPSLINALLYCIMFSSLSFFAQAASMTKVSSLLKSFQTGLRFLLLLVVFEMFILIISTGLMLLLKNGA